MRDRTGACAIEESLEVSASDLSQTVVSRSQYDPLYKRIESRSCVAFISVFRSRPNYDNVRDAANRAAEIAVLRNFVHSATRVDPLAFVYPLISCGAERPERNSEHFWMQHQ